MLSLLLLIPFLVLLVFNVPFLKRARGALPVFILLAALYQVFFSAVHGFGLFDAVPAVSSIFFSLNLAADRLSLFMLLTIAVVVLAGMSTAIASIEDPRRRFRFFSMLTIAMIGMNGTVLLTDLFSLYVFLEISAISSFLLISLDQEEDALEGAFKYLMLSAVATVFMLSATALLFMMCGGTSFAAVRDAAGADPGNAIIKAAVGIFLCGLFIKGGLVPFHWWLPDAYSSAPPPVSVLLAGIVTKISGIYTVMRILATVFGLTPAVQDFLLLLGAVSIVAGALMALGQSDMKRMLAYSSISQVGYIVLGFGCGTALGAAGAVFHLFNHAVFKSLLFINAASVEERLGHRDMDRMGGLASRMPVTGATSIVAFLSAAGIPPLAGFWSKLVIVIALWNAGRHSYAAVAVLAGLLTMAYFLSIQRKVFFGKLREGLEDLREGSPALALPAILLSALAVAAGVLYPAVVRWLILPIGAQLSG